MKETLQAMARNTEARVASALSRLKKTAKLTDYEAFTFQKNDDTIWTQALQTAVDENEIVEIPPSDKPYLLDGSVILGSRTKIVAYGATIRLTADTDVLMLRNRNVKNGMYEQTVTGKDTDGEIAIFGGRWEESNSTRLGYGKTGKFDPEHSMKGVSACMLFSNVRALYLKDLTFYHTAGFSVQIGNARDIVIDTVFFDDCFADGIHVNGNTENVFVRELSGRSWDDLIALNAYDWQNSSINFGPIRNVLIDGIHIFPDSRFKDLRILPGIYRMQNGVLVDCCVENVLVQRVKGVKCFKIYYQTPAYTIGEEPEWGTPGNADELYFEDIEIDLRPDGFPNYVEADPVTGKYGAWEIGANVGLLHLENVRITTDYARFPLGKPVCIGPKSSCRNGKEIFDPYVCCKLDRLTAKNVTVNGTEANTPDAIAWQVIFNQIYDAPRTSGKGEITEFRFSS